jgi:hypothetical protein
MKTLEELKAFCIEWHKAALVDFDGDVSGLDEWFRWGGYDLNIFGSHYGVALEDETTALMVAAYPDNWSKQLPEPIHTFVLTGETA